ncbi:serum paraoxonase/arylesterase [Colletotrichum graminicola]|uniref:Serum paraoxonase/arylesterase n=1 Tax=Colletotrichum graminicola (strain M1.001 / M2 / FGSC 10212) TaxID=645133 RepID=E3QVJ4_COLGM|nr:serum paraoxonase/arylesterase [Colletotrichum graminicola M1.001]EFQ34882.1 serum paraoxonase/arylesterase [Colletotrichum graminicola M1.001]WDK12922.1 serum paraoxonase/arylesterase [Colletotrichum graminicola]
MAALMPILVAGLAIFGGYTYLDTARRVATLTGIGREVFKTPVLHGGDFVLIDDTVHCEDIHHHVPSGLLFTACEDDETTRGAWFPGLGHLDDPVKGSKQKGSIHVIDPKDMSQKRLKFENFDSTFCTHGIDVISDPQKPEAVYVFAVNHVPHPDYLATKIGGQSEQKIAQKSLSRVEIFHHTLGSSTIKHLRTVIDPLIKNPNDLFAKDPYSFYVTNDHYHSEGVGRMVEDLLPVTSWTTTIHVRVKEMSVLLPTDGIKTEVALSGLRNNNGLGHGRKSGEIIVGNAAAGEISLAELSSDPKNTSISLTETVAMDSCIDNPSWFEDPYRSESQDASGFVLAGLSRPIEILKQATAAKPQIASIVWYVKPTASGGYEKRILFEDDGTRISSAATAVLVAIDPSQEKGKKKAWLFITGFLSSNVVAVKVDL